MRISLDKFRLELLQSKLLCLGQMRSTLLHQLDGESRGTTTDGREIKEETHMMLLLTLLPLPSRPLWRTFPDFV